MSHSHPPIVIPETKIPGMALGRGLIVHSEANLAYPMRPLLQTGQPRISRIWWRRSVFNQGNDSDCVLESSSGLCLSSPFRVKLNKTQQAFLGTHEDRMRLYRRAQELDNYPGVNYDGTSTDAGFKALREAGYISEWRWCLGDPSRNLSGLDDVQDTLSQHGPVVIGVNWYDSFDSPGYHGRLRISPNSGVRGGHAIELFGVNFMSKTVRGANSWGPDWADHGYFDMGFDVLERLLSEDGEACTAVQN